MINWLNISLLCLATYIIGSIPFAYIYGRVFKGIDIREHGSKNVGATNTLRVFGVKAGVLVLALDILKGFLPVFLFARYEVAWLPVLIGVCAILGHTFTIFLRFKGGKGVATSAGVMLALALWPTLAAIGLFAVVVAITRYVSLGSMTAVLALLILCCIYYRDNLYILGFVAVLTLFIFYTHRPNIKRLLSGTENRFGSKIRNYE